MSGEKKLVELIGFFLGKIFVISNNLGKVKFNFCMSKTLFRSTSF